MQDPPVSESDRARIRAAIEKAEAATSGEIFTVLAAASDSYRLVPLLWATLLALVVPAPLIYFTALTVPTIYELQLGTFALLAVLFSIPAVRPLLVPRRLKEHAAHARAVEQFMAHGLHTTPNRTGALIFVSFAERYAEIIADTGINSKVAPNAWDAIIAGLVTEIGSGRVADGIVTAVDRLGALLAAHFPPRPPHADRLGNDLVVLSAP